ncbi:hypothetical protein E1295_34395 [Nonomuraea mesophila]|uniref:Uncharacterized protein n=1 Tax=Nonomuraea mesophila TaxID=2530382 RepID=A0A4R5ESG6_9ACTN|nr:hypothetical protein [Nonomuraea mesophila]TDE37590.1 hypothetical protein E1295_34395 [Nonomuraea mesophila]
MDALSRGLIIAAAAILPGEARRERYREQWLADGEGAAELGIGSLSVAFGAVRVALAMNLTRRSAPALGLAVVLVVGGIRLATTTSGGALGAALAMAGVALPFLLLIVRRFTERHSPGDGQDALAAGRARPASRAPDAGPDWERLQFVLVGGTVLVFLAVLLLHS